MHSNNTHTNQQSVWKYRTRLPHCQIWQHSILRTIAQAYPIDNYELIHTRINLKKQHIVNTIGTVTDNHTHQLYLLIERIPNRLSQVYVLNQAQTLKVLYSTFKGLIQLEDAYGIIGLNQSCICFNEHGKVKIWINSDLGSFHPRVVLRESGGNYNKMYNSLLQIVTMVEKKCFNSGFLRNFIQKINEHKIKDYRQAAQEVLKISQLLFIDIEQKPINMNRIHHQGSSNHKTQHIPEKDTNKHVKTQIQDHTKLYKESARGHQRKLSNHDSREVRHRRIQSFIDPQTQPYQVESKQTKQSQEMPNNLSINFSKFTQSQAFDMSKPNFHKSAPMSPRQLTAFPQKQLTSHNNPPSTQRTQRKQSTPKLATYSHPYHQSNSHNLNSNYPGINANKFHKKMDPNKIICETIKQDQSQFDDSFSQNFKYDEKQILVSGQFQTFGILDDLSGNSQKKPKNNKNDQKHQKLKTISHDVHADHDEGHMSTKQSQFDIETMDKQIQKKLEKKTTSQQQQQKKRTSILRMTTQNKYEDQTPSTMKKNSCHKPLVFQNKKQKQIQQVTHRQKQNISSLHFNNTNNGNNHTDIFAMHNQNQIASHRSKSPSLAYIDKKYEQYIHSRKQSSHQNQHPTTHQHQHQHQLQQNQSQNTNLNLNMNINTKNIRKHSKHMSNFQNIATSNDDRYGWMMFNGLNTAGLTGNTGYSKGHQFRLHTQR